MDITFDCGWCGQSIVIDEAGAGRQVECPKCGKPLTVPGAPVPTVDASKKCPFCAEQIRRDAIKCKHCGEFLDAVYKREKLVKSPSSVRHNYRADAAETGKAGEGAIAVAYLLALPVTWAGLAMGSNMPAPDGYFIGLFMPILSFFVGLYLLVRKRAGHGIACMAAAVLQAMIFLSVFRP